MSKALTLEASLLEENDFHCWHVNFNGRTEIAGVFFSSSKEGFLYWVGCVFAISVELSCQTLFLFYYYHTLSSGVSIVQTLCTAHSYFELKFMYTFILSNE